MRDEDVPVGRWFDARTGAPAAVEGWDIDPVVVDRERRLEEIKAREQRATAVPSVVVLKRRFGR